MDPVVKPGECNICLQKVGSGDNCCPQHFGIIPHLWNQNIEFDEYQHFLLNKRRQQQNLPSIEFVSKKPKQFE
jgi:hypothetical protein